uniref:chitinase n=1 Tax=Solanum chacoense TaxID=4108 RepID=A0A0V0HP46_SOLCH
MQARGALCPSGLCCSNYGWCGNTQEYCGSDECHSQCPDKLISNPTFDLLLDNRNDDACEGSDDFYNYDAFIDAASSFPDFGTTGDVTSRRREIAAFFAQTSHQTTAGEPTSPDGAYEWGYCLVRELGSPGNYCTPSDQWPCAPGKKYFGRGPIQISHNYNYGPCGKAIGQDLLDDPDLVATDSVISFKSAIWFWMTPQPPKPSCHDVISGKWQPSADDRAANRLPGYGVITNIINGDLECGHVNDSRVQDRIGFYKRYCEILGVSPGDNLDCGNQRPFGR